MKARKEEMTIDIFKCYIHISQHINENSSASSRYYSVAADDIAQSSEIEEFLKSFRSHQIGDSLETNLIFTGEEKEKIVTSLTDSAANTEDYIYRRDDESGLTCELKIEKVSDSISVVIFKVSTDLGGAFVYQDGAIDGSFEHRRIDQGQHWYPEEVCGLFEKIFNCSTLEVPIRVFQSGAQFNISMPVTENEAFRILENGEENEVYELVSEAEYDLIETIANCMLEQDYTDLRNADLSNEEIVAFTIEVTE